MVDYGSMGVPIAEEATPMQSRRRERSFLAFLVSVFALCAWSEAPAVVVGTGDPASCTQAALAAAIDAGGEVLFNCGASPIAIPINGLVITSQKAVTIDGQALISLDGGGENQIVNIFGGPGPLETITLRNLTLANGSNTTGFNAGGAIINGGVLVLENVTFVNNVAPFGGAIVSERCNDCAAASVTVRNSTFANNRANAGGASNIQSDTLVVTETTFVNNAGVSGGAIELFGNAGFTVNASIWRNTFVGNVAAGFGGGAIRVHPLGPGGSATITNNTFNSNRADGDAGTEDPRGGALYLGQAATLAHNTIAGNTAIEGGGIYFASTGSTLANSIVADNTGGNCAGSMFAIQGNNLQSGDSTC